MATSMTGLAHARGEKYTRVTPARIRSKTLKVCHPREISELASEVSDGRS